jgi:hypothetical protein
MNVGNVVVGPNSIGVYYLTYYERGKDFLQAINISSFFVNRLTHHKRDGYLRFKISYLRLRSSVFHPNNNKIILDYFLCIMTVSAFAPDVGFG